MQSEWMIDLIIMFKNIAGFLRTLCMTCIRWTHTGEVIFICPPAPSTQEVVDQFYLTLELLSKSCRTITILIKNGITDVYFNKGMNYIYLKKFKINFFFWRVLMMEYNIQNYWVFGLFPSSSSLKKYWTMDKVQKPSNSEWNLFVAKR
jgi:hypothetical protein